MRPFVVPALKALAAVVVFAGPATAQTETRLYDHVHMSVPDPQAAAQWYHDHIGGEWVDGRTDRLLFGTTRIMFLRGQDRTPSAGGVIDHLGFSYPDLDAKLAEVETAGATVTTAARDVPGLFKLSFVVDPWGTRLELIEEPQHLGFHHVHLRSPDPEADLQWYEDTFGGVRFRLRGRLDGILYPGNVWLLIQRGETFPSRGASIDHIGWRAPDLDPTLADLRARGVEITCSFEVEMSGLVEIGMSSFGLCSLEVERADRSGGGDADIEPAGSRSTGGIETGEGRTCDGEAGCRAGGTDTAPFSSTAPEVGGTRGPSGDSWSARSAFEPGAVDRAEGARDGASTRSSVQ